MIYFDSSALVKRYIEEHGTEKVKSLIALNEEIITSKLTYPEMLSAFNIKYKTGEINSELYNNKVAEFIVDWDYFHVIEFDDGLLPIIKSIIHKYHLRGADSIQLSSALWFNDSLKEEIIFVSSDIDLLKAAESEGLQIIDPQ